MKDKNKKGVDLGLRQFIKNLGYVAGGPQNLISSMLAGGSPG